MELLIVTGMSGAGKSRALDALEDIGYYCIDNLPPQFLVNFADFIQQNDQMKRNVAIGVDVRSKEMFSEMDQVLDQLVAKGIPFKTLFLDCDTSILLHRYKETRRTHPLMDDHILHIEEAIAEEKQRLALIRDRASYLVDTTSLTTSQLKEKVVSLFSSDRKDLMHINFVSFGFKYGLIGDADLVFDVRCLPNPYYIPELKQLTGEDAPVRDYVMSFAQAEGLLKHIVEYLEFSIPLYIAEGKSQLVVGIGCTGGKHRSVTFARLLGEYFLQKEMNGIVSHRDIKKL